MSEPKPTHANEILKALLRDEQAHRLYHQEAQFRVSLIQLSNLMAVLLQDMTMAAEVRREGMRAAVEEARRQVFPLREG